MLTRTIHRLWSNLSKRSYSIRPGMNRPELDFDYLLNPMNKKEIRQNIANRKQVGNIDQVHELWNRLNSVLIDQHSSSSGSKHSSSSGSKYASSSGSKDSSSIGSTHSSSIDSLKPSQLQSLWDEFYEACIMIPNRTHEDTPIGDESKARLVESVGERRSMDFKPHTAEQIGTMLRAIKTSSSDTSTVAGDKAYFLYDNMALFERALIDYSLSIVQRNHGFELIYVPDVLNIDIPKKCGLTSRTELNIVYSIKTNLNHCLSGTGEMGMASYLEGKIFDQEQLPRRFVTLTRCYRPEVASGKVNRGLYRVHEFTKVEMFAITRDEKEESDRMLDEFVDIQKEIVNGLQLHCRLLDMPSRELGAAAYRKFDIEAWMPGRNVFGEISSASNCTDYQSRRLGTEYKTSTGQTRFVHTVNGTACATSRMIIAVMEQHQRKSKLVEIPEALKPFFNNWPVLYPSRSQLKMQGYNPRMFRMQEDSSQQA